MADSFGKRQRQRGKEQKQREKAERKRQRREDGTPAPTQGATWYELVGEQGGALPGDAGAEVPAETDAERKRKERGSARE